MDVANDIRILATTRFTEALIISKIPGASHCALEGNVIAEIVRDRLKLPVLEIEVPSLCESMRPSIQTRINALVEIVKDRRTK